MPASKRPVREPVPDASTPRYRSGAVARMVRMPVATLRIWERRYGVTAPATTPTGHRLYSSAEVQRLALLKQLTELGHAIGSIAALDMRRLLQVASTHASTLARGQGAAAPAAAPWRVVVVGAALAHRLQRPSLAHALGRPLTVVAVFDTLSQARRSPAARRAEALLWHAPTLHDDVLSELQAAARAWRAKRIAAIYGFAAATTSHALGAAGVALLREPQDDRALAAWLRRLDELPAPAAPATADRRAVPDPLWMAAGVTAPRRYDDATLTDLAGLSSTIACECPRHVAELLMQLSHFEAYSAECENRSPADADLHAYLQRVAGASRALFESALERVAIQEGLMLPA